MEKSKRQRAMRRRRIFICLCVLVLVMCVALLGVFINTIVNSVSKSEEPQKENSQISSGAETGNETEKREPVTATVLNTGDLLLHENVLLGAKQADSSYDFSDFFKEASGYIKAADYAVANLEVTFGGTEAGRYSGYPVFNSPDSLADCLKADGFDMLLTANNHSLDTGLAGLKRTVQQLKQRSIDFLGTKETQEDPTYIVKDINGIKIGMVCYTYGTNSSVAGAGALINTFSVSALESFYTQAQSVIDSMYLDGAEAVVFYMHWGNEYQTSPNTYQKSIAQRLCNMGVDVIVGGHPHVIQPIELIYSEDSQNTTVCIYSVGNAISNQRIEEMTGLCESGHTEDGMLFSYTFTKYDDGTVELSSVDIIPTWVNRYGSSGDYNYTMYPLENEAQANSYGFDAAVAKRAQASYNRTKKIVASGLTECQQHLGCEIRFSE